MTAVEIRRWGTYAFLVVTLLLSGCTGARLYRAADDEAAQKAKSAITAADLQNALAPERLALQAFRKREQEVVRRNQASLRDGMLVALLSATDEKSSWQALEAQLKERSTTLVGETDTTAIAIETAIRQAEDAQRKADVIRETYLLASGGKIRLQCPLLVSQRPASAELEPLYRVHEKACGDYLAAKKGLSVLQQNGGAFKVFSTQVEEIKAARKTLQESLVVAKTNYADALEKAKAPQPAEGSLEKLGASLKAGFDGLAVLPKSPILQNNQILSRLLEEGKLEQLKTRKTAVDELVQALQGDLAADATPAQQRLAALGDLERAIGSPPPPPVSALILEAEFLKQEANGLEKHISRANERIALLEKKKASMEEEIFFLNDATKSLRTFNQYASAGKKNCAKRNNIYDTFNSASANCRFLLAQTLSAYVNAWTFGRAQQELIDYQLIAQGHDAALDDSEIALAQTHSLILAPVDQLAKIYAGGIKPEDLSNLIQALGFTAIAVRLK